MLYTDPSYEKLCLMAIDPGLNNTGIAIFQLDLKPVKIVSIEAWTIQADKLIDDCGLDDEDFIERLHKRHNLGHALRGILKNYQPSWVVSESPFFDRFRPGSFAILTEVMTTILDTIVATDPGIRFSVVEPLVVKKVLGVAGQKGKEVVRDAMAKQTTLLSVLKTPLETLSEHAIDAIGVGYAFLLKKSDLKQEFKEC